MNTAVDELLELFSNSTFTPIENINNILNSFEVETFPQFQNVISAVRSGDRQKITENLFFGSYRTLNDFILSDPRMTQEDASLILSSISQQLNQYDPSTHELGFNSWCESIIQRQVEFYTLRRQYRNSVRKGLWAILRGCSDLGFDYSVFAELENKAWTKVFLRLDELLEPGSAKLSTRLYSLARFTAREWRTERIRNRAKFITLDEFRRIEEGITRPKKASKTQAEFDLFDPEVAETSLDELDDSTPLFIQ